MQVAFIGKAGTPHQSNYLQTLPLMRRVARVSVCDLAGGKMFGDARKSLANRLEATYTDVDACLESGPYAFVIVSLDNRAANGVVRRVLESGNHVFAEKTAARNYAEFRPLEEYAREHGLHLGMAYLNRMRPSVLDAKRLIAEGVIGKLYGFYVQSIASQARLRDPQHNWTFDPDLAGGGYLIWLGCHYLDLLRWITGREVVSVGAITDVISGLPLNVEDAAALTLRLDNGAIGTANFGYYMNGLPEGGAYQSQITVWGELGWIRIFPGEDDKVPLELQTNHQDYAGAPYRTIFYRHHSIPQAYGSAWGLSFLDRFADAVAGDADPIISASDAGAVLKIIDAAYESSRSKRFIE